ncbi:MAG: tail fiber protein [Saprospiraceae bacterium]|nr:tail fiber protein [Saprospiraceae bacterium]
MESFIGVINLFFFKQVPSVWIVCEGQLSSINAKKTLFALIGINLGEDGKTNFALPNLRGKALIASALK